MFFSDLLESAMNKIESKLDDATEYLESTTIDDNIADLKRAGGNAARKIGHGLATAVEYVAEEAPKWAKEAKRQQEVNQAREAREAARQAAREQREFERDMRELDKAIKDFEDY